MANKKRGKPAIRVIATVFVQGPLVSVWRIRRFARGRVRRVAVERIQVVIVEVGLLETAPDLFEVHQQSKGFREILEKHRNGLYENTSGYAVDLVFLVGLDEIEDVLIEAQEHAVTAIRFPFGSKERVRLSDKAQDCNIRASRMAQRLHLSFGGRV